MEKQDYKDLLMYFVPKYGICVREMSPEEAIKRCKSPDTALLCKDKTKVYVVENRYGEFEIIPPKVAGLLWTFHNEIRGL